MLRHMVGRVYILNPEPQEELPLVEIPAMSLPEGIPLALVLEVGEEGRSRLSESEKEKLKYLHAQKFLSLSVIRENSPFDPYAQIEIARRIDESPEKSASMFSWKGRPNAQQLKLLVELIYTVLLHSDKKKGIVSGEQLFYRLVQAQNYMPYGFRAYFEEFRRKDKGDKSVDEMLRAALSFLRTWMEFQLPRSIMAINRIQKHVLTKYGLPVGDYTEYAEAVKHWFRPPAETILEEYGVPMPMTTKIGSVVRLPETVDEVLAMMSKLNIDQFQWSNIERQILLYAFPNPTLAVGNLIK